ncbi:MAG: phosphopantetheine-protein transferase [Francisellaceae bacterium]|nr:phosphopantetheine-protein transferase [Francisellaceae bacterium]
MNKLNIEPDHWLAGPLLVNLDPKNIHVWRVNLPLPKKVINRLINNLSLDELDRLKKISFPKHKEMFIISRGVLKDLIARYLNISVKNIFLSFNEYGKPFLKYHNLYFNVSHTKGCLLYAFCLKTSVGIDIEKRETITDILSLATLFFSENEYLRFLELDNSEKPLAFYRCWTRKESYLKAIGIGLSFPMNQIEVSFYPDQKAELINTNYKTGDLKSWRLKEIILDDNFIACLASQAPYNLICLWNW